MRESVIRRSVRVSYAAFSSSESRMFLLAYSIALCALTAALYLVSRRKVRAVAAAAIGKFLLRRATESPAGATPGEAAGVLAYAERPRRRPILLMLLALVGVPIAAAGLSVGLWSAREVARYATTKPLARDDVARWRFTPAIDPTDYWTTGRWRNESPAGGTAWFFAWACANTGIGVLSVYLLLAAVSTFARSPGARREFLVYGTFQVPLCIAAAAAIGRSALNPYWPVPFWVAYGISALYAIAALGLASTSRHRDLETARVA